MGTEDEPFTFTGLTDSEKQKVELLKIFSSKIQFVPREVLTEFPKLHTIFIQDLEMEVLTFDYLNTLLKLVLPKITKVSFYGGRLRSIDPQVVTIFKKLNKVNLEKNLCVNKYIQRNNFKQIDSILKNCINNYNQLENSEFDESTEQEQEAEDESNAEMPFQNLISKISELTDLLTSFQQDCLVQ